MRPVKRLLQSDNLPLVTLSVGIVGVALQLWLLSTGIDEKGLFLPHHPAPWFLIALCAAFVAVLYYSLENVKIAPYGALYPASLVAGIGNLLAGGAILTANLNWGGFGVLLQGVSALSFGYIGFCRATRRRPHFAAASVICLFFALFTISQYRHWSAEPQLIAHLFPLCACISMMLTAYHHAAMDAGFGSRRWLVFFSQLSLLFSCLCLTGENMLLHLGIMIWNITGICRLSGRGMFYLPKNVKFCIEALEKAGFSCYAVGGCVRDSVLGIDPQDYDLCTNATPEEISEVFSQYSQVHSGVKHGTVGVILDHTVYEITTFRTEGGYTDSRHPDWVKFVSSVQEDLARRDFTVNAMAYSPRAGLVDPWGGKQDLRRRVLRTVGDPTARFTEDPLRILRGVRFAIRYRLTPEKETEQAMTSLAPLMENLARERVFSELCKILPLISAEQLLRYKDIFIQIIPELAPTVDFQQRNSHHIHDVFTHTAYVVENTPRDCVLRWAALLHDLGKPATFTMGEDGQGHFYGHAEESARMAEEILRRLKAPNDLREQVVFLVKRHMTDLVPDKKVLRRRLSQQGERGLKNLIALQKADKTGKHGEGNDVDFSPVERLIEEILQEDACLQIKDLAISGNDLLALGYAPGPQIGKCMAYLLDEVLQETLLNTRESLLPAAKDFLDK